MLYHSHNGYTVSCLHFLVLCKSSDQDFITLQYVLFYISAINTYFEFQSFKFVTCNFRSLTHFADSSTNPQSTHTLPFSQEETNDIVLVEKYWHPGHALFIVYFGH